mgnify:FL=1
MVRSSRRRAGKATKKLEGRPKVYLPVPDEFLDIMGEPWSSMRAGVVTDMDLAEVLMFTVRHAPVKTAGDVPRTLDIFNAINEASDGTIEMVRDDWDWMLTHFKEMAHNVWKAPDSAYLVRWLEENVTDKPAGVA